MKFLSLDFKDCMLDVDSVKQYKFSMPTISMLDALRRCITPQEAMSLTIAAAMVKTCLSSNEQQRTTITSELIGKNALQHK